MKKILIITSSFDTTSDYMEDRFKNRVDFIRINVDLFDKYKFSITNEGVIFYVDRQKYNLKNIDSIYYRKPYFPDVSKYSLGYQRLIKRDILTLIDGIVEAYDGIVLTKPSILRKTENKVYQLLYCNNAKILIPDSYIGNMNEAGFKYIALKSVIKPLSLGKVSNDKDVDLLNTSLFNKFDENDDISLTPVYLQEYVKKNFEVRITVVLDKFFAVRIDTKNKVDWRLDYENHKYSLISCPQNVVLFCKKMMKDFCLNFGTFDFIITPNNEWIFLEINPNGQWLWLEEILELSISDNIMKILTNFEDRYGDT